jgi:hypothetical protein
MVKPKIERCGNGACLGAEMDSSAFPFSRPEKYCHNGRGLVAEGVPARGVRDRHLGPHCGSQEAASLQGKAAESGGPCPLGAAMDSSAFSEHAKYCHNGGMALRPPLRRPLAGVQPGDDGPPDGPLETARLREKREVVRGPFLWGRQWTRLPPPPTPAATPAPAEDLAKSADERKSSLDRTLADRGAQGWRIENRSDFQATIASGNRINHVLHLILAIVTAGLWGIVWIILAIRHQATPHHGRRVPERRRAEDLGVRLAARPS